MRVPASLSLTTISSLKRALLRPKFLLLSSQTMCYKIHGDALVLFLQCLRVVRKITVFLNAYVSSTRHLTTVACS